MKRRLIIVITFLTSMLAGCAIISVGYNYADTYLRYSINSYATFNDGQKEIIKKEVSVFMQWHRKNMLPEYVRFLQGLQQAAQSDVALKKQDVARFRSGVRALYVKTLLPTVRPAARMLSGVDAEQIQEMVKSFAKENRKQRDKELAGNPDEQLRKRAERTIDFLENLVGGFTDEQLDKIREMSRNLPFATGIYLQLRENNQARLIELLKNNKDEAEIFSLLSSWLTTPEAHVSPEDRSIMLAFENASDEMIVNFFQMLTERQKKTLQKNITKYIDIFQDLASET